MILSLLIASLVFLGSRAGAQMVCDEQCLSQEAGYQWARLNNITEAKKCLDQDPAFASGCRAYLEAKNNEDHGRVLGNEARLD